MLDSVEAYKELEKNSTLFASLASAGNHVYDIMVPHSRNRFSNPEIGDYVFFKTTAAHIGEIEAILEKEHIHCDRTAVINDKQICAIPLREATQALQALRAQEKIDADTAERAIDAVQKKTLAAQTRDEKPRSV